MQNTWVSCIGTLAIDIASKLQDKHGMAVEEFCNPVPADNIPLTALKWNLTLFLIHSKCVDHSHKVVYSWSEAEIV